MNKKIVYSERKLVRQCCGCGCIWNGTEWSPVPELKGFDGFVNNRDPKMNAWQREMESKGFNLTHGYCDPCMERQTAIFDESLKDVDVQKAKYDLQRTIDTLSLDMKISLSLKKEKQ